MLAHRHAHPLCTENYTDKEIYERMLFTAHRNIEALKEQIPTEHETLAVSVARREKLPRIKRASVSCPLVHT